MVIVGGVGTLFGGVVGAAVIIVLENVVSSFTERWSMVLGALFVLTMIFAPEGIVGKLRSYLAKPTPRAEPHPSSPFRLHQERHHGPQKLRQILHRRARGALPPSAPSTSGPEPRALGPIKIGLLTPLTGVVASGGKEIAEGFNLYWDQVGKQDRQPRGAGDGGGRRLQPRHRPAEGAQADRADQGRLPHRQPAGQHRPGGGRVHQGLAASRTSSPSSRPTT